MCGTATGVGEWAAPVDPRFGGQPGVICLGCLNVQHEALIAAGLTPLPLDPREWPI